MNRLLWRVHETRPGDGATEPQSLDRAKHQRKLAQLARRRAGIVAELARDELADIDRLTEQINELERRITDLVEVVAPTLLAMPGVGPLTAAKIVGETAGVTRFRSEAAFARHAGVAPIPVWSGNTAGRVRMTRSGNRQLNAALHRIAVTQIRIDGLGQDLLREEEGRRQVQSRSPALPQTPPRPHRLQRSPHRSRRQRQPNRRHACYRGPCRRLIDIGATRSL